MGGRLVRGWPACKNQVVVSIRTRAGKSRVRGGGHVAEFGGVRRRAKSQSRAGAGYEARAGLPCHSIVELTGPEGKKEYILACPRLDPCRPFLPMLTDVIRYYTMLNDVIRYYTMVRARPLAHVLSYLASGVSREWRVCVSVEVGTGKLRARERQSTSE